MAIAVSEPVAEISSTANVNSYATGSFTPTASSLLVIHGVIFGSADSIMTVSGGSLIWNTAYTTLRGAISPTEIYIVAYAQVGASPSSMTITMAVTDVGTGAQGAIFQYTGHDVTSPVRQVKESEAVSTNGSVTMDAAMVTTSGYSAMLEGRFTASNSVTEPSSWTETADTFISTPNRSMASAYRAGGETGSTITFTHASTNWVLTAIEINVASTLKRHFMLMGVG